MQCDMGFSVEADFLYWFARENNMPYSMTIQNQYLDPSVTGLSAPTAYAPTNANQLGTKWSPGFRIGLGWNTNHDGWDAKLTWTWYQNHKSGSSSADFAALGGAEISDVPAVGSSALINAWVNQSMIYAAAYEGDNEIQITFDDVSASWRLHLNQIDFEWGRKSWVSKHTTLRPYAGIRGAWKTTTFQTHSTATRNNVLNSTASATSVDRDFKDKFKDRQWGLGIVAGLQPNWYFGCDNQFSIYANVDAALIYGKLKSEKRESYSQVVGATASDASDADFHSIDFSDEFENRFWNLIPIIDLGLGLSWVDYWCNDQYRFELDIGWEHHVWFNTAQRIVTNDGLDNEGFDANYTFASYDKQDSDLTFGGLVVRVKFDF
jgi:hypothetical protein